MRSERKITKRQARERLREIARAKELALRREETLRYELAIAAGAANEKRYLLDALRRSLSVLGDEERELRAVLEA